MSCYIELDKAKKNKCCVSTNPTDPIFWANLEILFFIFLIIILLFVSNVIQKIHQICYIFEPFHQILLPNLMIMLH